MATLTEFIPMRCVQFKALFAAHSVTDANLDLKEKKNYLRGNTMRNF